MKYDFRCEECGSTQTVDLSMQQFEQKKASGIDCSECDGNAEWQFNAASVEFCFKGDAWSDKNYREKKYRKNRSKYMAQRQAKNHKRPTLQPNYKGEVADSWKEVQEVAAADGKNASTYEPLIRKERAESR